MPPTHVSILGTETRPAWEGIITESSRPKVIQYGACTKHTHAPPAPSSSPTSTSRRWLGPEFWPINHVTASPTYRLTALDITRSETRVVPQELAQHRGPSVTRDNPVSDPGFTSTVSRVNARVAHFRNDRFISAVYSILRPKPITGVVGSLATLGEWMPGRLHETTSVACSSPATPTAIPHGSRL